MDLDGEITSLCQRQFGTNLAGIALFGSYVSGPYIEGVSDIDCLVFVKQRAGMNLEAEKEILNAAGANVKLSVQRLSTVEEAYDRIYREGSWSTWITLVCGSRIAYASEIFDAFILRLRAKNLPRENLIEYIKHKDSFELHGYLRRITGWELTRAFYSHIRRKLQILSFSIINQPVFDYRACLANTNLDDKTKGILANLASYYENRRSITGEEAAPYFEISARLTKRII